MLYDTFPSHYDIVLEPQRKKQLPPHNICLKHDNEETIQGGPQETTKTLRMITKSTREPLATRKQKLKVKLINEEAALERELGDKLCEREKTKVYEDEEIARLKRTLENLFRNHLEKEKELSETLLKKQEDLKRLNLLNTSSARDLAQLIKTRSTEYNKDCSVANVHMMHDKRNQKQNVMLWETQWLNAVLFPDNLEEKEKQSRNQIHDFIVANSNLIQLKWKEREEELKRDEEWHRCKVEEAEREQREEDNRREQEKQRALQNLQAQVDYMRYKKKEREACERQEKEKELAGNLLELERQKQEEKERKKRETENVLEEQRLSLLMKEKYKQEMKQREKELEELIEAEYTQRSVAKLNEQAALELNRKRAERETHQMLCQQIAEREKIREEKEREKEREMKYFQQLNRELEAEKEREKKKRELEREKHLAAIKAQIEFGQHRNPC